ncbi:MAG: Ig-like domain-containing protein, partial [Deltaproteobacteria bacterium]|nr:Ig-like domain-containing protein [Deltaproteobacteria bacterium]
MRKITGILVFCILVIAACSDQPFVVGVDSPLRVVYISPTDSATNVSRDVVVKVVFSDEVVEDSLTDNVVLYDFSKKDESMKVETDLTYSKDTNTVFLKPRKSLNFATQYLIRVKSGVTKVNTKDSKGGRLAREISAVFTTEYIDDLKIVSVLPSNGATGVAPDTNIVVTFSEAIDTSPPSFDQTSSFVVCDVGSADSYVGGKCKSPISGSWSFDETKRIATFKPETNFGFARAVRLILSTSVRSQRAKDFGDNVGGKLYGHLSSDYTVDFMTKLLDRFDVLSVSPANGASGIVLSSQIIIRFSEAVNKESVVFFNKEGDESALKDTATLFVEDITDKDNTNFYYMKGEWDSETKTLTLTNVDPKDGDTKKDFPYSRNIRITLKSRIQSERGKNLVNPPEPFKTSQGYLNNNESDYVSVFSTIDPPELLILNTEPSPDSKSISIRGSIKITFSDVVDLTTLIYPEKLDSSNYTFALKDITDGDKPLLVEPSDRVNPFKVNSGEPNTVVFTPKYPLKNLHTYQVELREGIASLRATRKSGFLRFPLIYNFETEGVERFYIASVEPVDGSQDNSIYSKARVRFNRAFRNDSLLELQTTGNVTQIVGRTVIDNNANMIPDTLNGYIVRFKGGSASCSGFITKNSEKTFNLSENPSCPVDNTFAYEVYKPALILSTLSSYIQPFNTDSPFFSYRFYETSGFVTSATNNTITDSGKSFRIDELKGRMIRFLRGKLAGESYIIESNTSDTIKISGQFPEMPDTTSEYIVVESSQVVKSMISSAESRSIKIVGAGFETDSLKGFELYVVEGKGKGQIRGIVANDVDTVFVDDEFETTPDNTSQIEIRDSREFIFVPKDVIAYNSLVTGRVTNVTTAAVSDSLNGKIDEQLFTFGVIKAPELVIKAVLPSDRADNIDTETPIKIYFSEAIDPASVKKESGNLILLDSASNPVDFAILPVGTESDNIEIVPVRAAPNQPRLKYSEKYTLVLKSRIASLRGGTLGKDYSFTFKTVDPPPLTILYSEPSNAENKVATGIKRETQQNNGIPTSFVIAFSEGVKQANVDLTTLKVEDVTGLNNPFDISQSGSPILYNINFNAIDTPPNGSLGVGADNTITITPSDLLSYSSVVRIVVKGQDDPVGINCGDSATCLTTGVMTSDRVTKEGGQLRNSDIIVFRIEDPEPLRIVHVSSERGDQYLIRDRGGLTESIFVRFTEGVKQSSFVLNNTVFFEDVTGLADPVNGNAIATIPAVVSFYDSLGNPAADNPITTDLIGKDTIAKITPQSMLRYATVVRLRIKGTNPPSFSGVHSDRATIINGQLPPCVPQSGYSCNNKQEYVYLFNVQRVNDLYVRSISPGDASTGIPYDSREIVIVFSEPLDCSTVNSTNIKVEQVYPLLTAISGNFTCNSDVVRFTANQDFGYSRDIRITIGTGVRSLEAQFVNPAAEPLMGHLRSPFIATFSTVDPPPPYIVSMNPGPGSTNVSRNSEVQVTFNEALNPSSINTTNFSLTDLSSMNVIPCASLSLINSNTTIRCVPAMPFAYSHSIAVSIRGGSNGIRSVIATERGGWFNPVPNPYTYTFSIIDIPELTILATNFSGTENFAPNGNLQIIFNSYVNFSSLIGNPSDISDDRIILVKQSDINTRIPVTITNPIPGGESSPSTVRITPSTQLDYSTYYSVFVFGGYPSGVCRPERDGTNKGGCITSELISGTPYKGLRFDFAVSSAPGLMVESTVPQDHATGIDRKPNIKVVFNNPIKFDSVDGNICLTKGNNQSTDCSGPLVIPLEPFTQIDSKTVSTYPSSNLDFDTTYTIVVTKGVVDIYGDSLDSFFTSVFTTITSTLVQDISVWDGAQYNNYMFYDINDAKFRIRFTKDMDTSTLNSGTIYLTYKNEFGQIIPLRGTLTWEAPPLDKKVLYFTPDLYNISVCDGGELFGWGNDGTVSNVNPNRFSSPSYNFDLTYVGKKIYISGSVNVFFSS